MRVQYGNYPHEDQECTLSPISRTGIMSEANVVVGFAEQWRIRGFLQGTNAADLTAKIAALEAAYSVQGQAIGLFNSDGSATAHGVTAGQAFGGVRIVSPPSFPVGEGAEYSTFRQYEIVVEWERRNPIYTLRAWSESILFFGGGPKIVFRESINAPPIKQQPKAFTTYRAIQRGQAIGLYDRPSPPPPLWPGDLEIAPEIEPVSARQYGLQTGDVGISWTYRFAAVNPFFGDPHNWPTL